MKLIEEESQCQRKRWGYFFHPLDDRYRGSPEALGTVELLLKLEQKTGAKLAPVDCI